jgi:hypothetical protein
MPLGSSTARQIGGLGLKKYPGARRHSYQAPNKQHATFAQRYLVVFGRQKLGGFGAAKIGKNRKHTMSPLTFSTPRNCRAPENALQLLNSFIMIENESQYMASRLNSFAFNN